MQEEERRHAWPKTRKWRNLLQEFLALPNLLFNQSDTFPCAFGGYRRVDCVPTTQLHFAFGVHGTPSPCFSVDYSNTAIMVINPHKLGVHKVLQHIPLNKVFDAPAKARLAKAVNIADLRLCAKQRAHKVSFELCWSLCERFFLGLWRIMCFVCVCAGFLL